MIQKLTGPTPQATAEQKHWGPMFVVLKCHVSSDTWQAGKHEASPGIVSTKYDTLQAVLRHLPNNTCLNFLETNRYYFQISDLHRK